MVSKKTIKEVYKILKKETKKYHLPLSDSVELKTKDPFKILVATILSARTKDSLTEKIVDELFKYIKKPEDLIKINIKKLEKLIYPVSFYRNKARNLKKLGVVLVEEYHSRIPETFEELIKLPGVGRKTANVVLAVAFKKQSIGVDTHVHKISNRLGWVKTKTPQETEIALKKILPKKYWKETNTYLVILGQNICRPISPKCSICPISKYCKKVGVKKSR